MTAMALRRCDNCGGVSHELYKPLEQAPAQMRPVRVWRRCAIVAAQMWAVPAQMWAVAAQMWLAQQNKEPTTGASMVGREFSIRRKLLRRSLH